MRLAVSTRHLVVWGLFAAVAVGCQDGEFAQTSGPGQATDDGGGAADVPEAGDRDAAEADAADRRDGGGAADGGTCERCPSCVACEYRDNPERSCRAPDADSPPRCEAEPTEFAGWGPGAVLTGLEVGTERAQECCFNLDGSEDGSPDNEVGALLADVDFEIDRMIKRGLLYEDYVGLAEFDGLSALDQSEPFTVHGYLGYFGSPDASSYVEKADPDCDLETADCELQGRAGERFWINPESLEEGARSQVQFEPAEVADSRLEAGPGDVSLDLIIRNLGRVVLEVRGVHVEADIDAEASDPEGDGVVVADGKIGGYVLLEDVIALLNGLLASCNCLDNPEEAIEVPNADSEDTDPFPEACESGEAPEEDCRFSCADEVLAETNRCSRRASRVCREADRLCALLNVLPGLADLDADGDGQLDALSFGARFEATGARIAGVGDYVRANDQRPGEDGELAIERVFASEPGWLAVYTSQTLEADTRIGHARLEAGSSDGFTVSTSEYEPGQRVWVVLYRDDGDREGVFEPEADSPAKRYPEASGVVSTSLWVRAQ